MKNEIATIDYENPETRKLIRNTLAQGATDQEFELFMMMCKGAGLNPAKKEAWCIPTGTGDYRKVQMMTGINGFLAIANAHPQYDGMVLNYGGFIEVSLPENSSGVKSIKVPEYVEALVYRKDRKYPSVARAYWREYSKDLVGKPYTPKNSNKSYPGRLGIWATLSSVMLAKCAKSMALREAFSQELNGFYTEEEMPKEFSQPETVEATIEPEVVTPEPKKEVKKTSKAQKLGDTNIDKVSIEEDEIPTFDVVVEEQKEIAQDEIKSMMPHDCVAAYDIAKIEQDGKMKNYEIVRDTAISKGVKILENSQAMLAFSSQVIKAFQNYRVL